MVIRLNPYSNGTLSDNFYDEKSKQMTVRVLILILMEHSLTTFSNGVTYLMTKVLILILMEHSLTKRSKKIIFQTKMS